MTPPPFGDFSKKQGGVGSNCPSQNSLSEKKKGIFTETSKIFFAFGEKQGVVILKMGSYCSIIPDKFCL